MCGGVCVCVCVYTNLSCALVGILIHTSIFYPPVIAIIAPVGSNRFRTKNVTRRKHTHTRTRAHTHTAPHAIDTWPIALTNKKRIGARRRPVFRAAKSLLFRKLGVCPTKKTVRPTRVRSFRFFNLRDGNVRKSVFFGRGRGWLPITFLAFLEFSYPPQSVRLRYISKK